MVKQTKKEASCVCGEADVTVKIAGTIGGLLITIVVLVLIFAKEQAPILVPIAISMCVMGVLLGYFAKRK